MCWLFSFDQNWRFSPDPEWLNSPDSNTVTLLNKYHYRENSNRTVRQKEA